MSAANTLIATGALPIGVDLEGVIHGAFTLRLATLADTYRAAASVPVPADVDANQAARVAYQMAVDDAEILCQLVRLGDLDPVPSPAALADILDPEDMAYLRNEAADLKKRLQQSRRSSLPSGEPSSSSSEPASV